MKYRVTYDHPVSKKYDLSFDNNNDAVDYASNLKKDGCENITITEFPQGFTSMMTALGCKEIRRKVFRHPLIDLDLDFEGTANDRILLRLAHIFSRKGREDFQQEFKQFIGI